MNIAIIGGGASGMILASKIKNHKATIYERNNKLGKKLLLTGNGKCNFTNMDFENLDDIYNNEFAINLYKRYDNKSFIEYFESIGIVHKVETHKKIDYVYPNSNKSTSVYYNLMDRINYNNTSVRLNSYVSSIIKDGDSFIVETQDGKKEIYDRVVIATGGKSYKNTGSDGNGYDLAKKLGHSIVSQFPGLCGLKTNDGDIKKLKGIRVEASVSVKSYDFVEIGEIQFTEHGVSGIPIMNLSSKISKYLSKPITIILNLAIGIDDNITEDGLFEYLKSRKNDLRYKKTKDFLCGFLPDELCDIIIKRSDVRCEDVEQLTETDIKNISKNIIKFNVDVIDTFGFDNAQVTIGGVNTCEIDNNSLESKIVKGLYFTGEVMDIDGKCGGYNLQLAYSTASIVSDSL